MVGKLLEDGNRILAEKKIGARVGAETGNVVRMTRAYFDSLAIETRTIDAVASSTEMKLFGKMFKTPIMAAALSGLDGLCKNGLVEVGRGILAAGSVMWAGIGNEQELAGIIGTGASTIKIIKPYKDHDLIYEKIQQAEKLGAMAVGMDVNFCFGGKVKDSIIRENMMGPVSMSELKRYMSSTKLPFVVKGVLSIKDAIKSIEAGAAAIVVSNHGGSIIDYAVPPLKMLPDIARHLEGKIPIFLDGGILRGSDVFKALALGAQGVLVGRTLMAGLAAGQSTGVCEIVTGLTEELLRIMNLTGSKDIYNIDPNVLWQM